MFNTVEIGHKISVLRRRAAMTQMELANKLGISYQAVSNWERGVSMPDISNLKEVANLLNTSVDELIGDKKAADIIENASNGKLQDISLTPEEFVEFSPILTAEQNDVVIKTVQSGFTDEQTEKIKPNLNFDGKYDLSDDELAESFLKNDNVSMFSIIANSISPKKRIELLDKAAKSGNVPFFSILLNRDIGDLQAFEYAKTFFENNNIACFSIVVGKLNEEHLIYFKDKAAKSGNLPFFAILHSKIAKACKSTKSTADSFDFNQTDNKKSKLSERKKKAETDLLDLKCEYSDLKNELFELKSQKRNTSKNDENYEDILEKIDDLEEKMDDLEEKMDDLEDEMDDLEDEIDDLEDEIDDLEDECSDNN